MTFDVVLTTYETVAGETTRSQNGSIQEAVTLDTYDWYRLVLDEGKKYNSY